MDYRGIFQITTAGMDLEKRRLEIAALNLANMHSSSAPGTEPYAIKRVVAQPVQWALHLNSEIQALATRPLQIVESETSARFVHDPGHPHANAQGMVAFAKVDQATEMVIVTSALRAYEANVAVASTARAMASKALEIGGQS